MKDETLQKIVIRGREAGPRLLISAGVHGDEYEGIEAIWELAKAISSEELKGELTLIPIVNEAAFRLRSRTAEDGKDLARTCPGSETGTITERIAARLAAEIRAAEYYIDLHTGGFKFKLVPLVGYMLHPDQRILEKQRRMAKAFGLPLIWGTTSELDGRSLSVARDAGVPSLYAEHGGGGGCDPAGIKDYVAGCLGVMVELGMLSRPLCDKPTPMIVEDPRKDSGHLQIHHPAPCAGYFRPVKRLGETIQAGATLGRIVDAVGKELAVIPAAQSGTVLLLSWCPVVEAGDTLGVILEQ